MGARNSIKEIGLIGVDLNELAKWPLGQNIQTIALFEARGEVLDLRSAKNIRRARVSHCPELTTIAGPALTELSAIKCKYWGAFLQELANLKWLVVTLCASADIGREIGSAPRLCGANIQVEKIGSDLLNVARKHEELGFLCVQGWKISEVDAKSLSLHRPQRTVSNGVWIYHNGSRSLFDWSMIPETLVDLAR